jgi:hypothetical protein
MASLLGIAISSAASYLYYQYSLFAYGPNDWGSKPFDVLYKGVGVHTIVDLYYSNTYEMKFHHFFILCILFYNEYYQAPIEHRFLFTYPMLKTEISSIFYVLNLWIPDKTNIYYLNKVLFCLSFIKFRIYDYYFDLVQENTLINNIIDIYSKELSSFLYLSIYGLYSLNIYWLFVLNKILYKLLFLSIDTDMHCHALCRIIYLVNILLALYVYPLYHFECIGTILHSFLAYLYHQDIYRQLLLKKIDEYVAPSKSNLLLYIGYIISLHGRSFCFMLTHYPYSISIILSGILHELSLYCSIYRVTDVLTEEKKEDFLKDQRRILAIPFLADALWIGLRASRPVPLYLLYFTLVVLHMVTPFYKLTPVAFSIGFLLQTYYISIQTY